MNTVGHNFFRDDGEDEIIDEIIETDPDESQHHPIVDDELGGKDEFDKMDTNYLKFSNVQRNERHTSVQAQNASNSSNADLLESGYDSRFFNHHRVNPNTESAQRQGNN